MEGQRSKVRCPGDHRQLRGTHLVSGPAAGKGDPRRLHPCWGALGDALLVEGVTSSVASRAQLGAGNHTTRPAFERGGSLAKRAEDPVADGEEVPHDVTLGESPLRKIQFVGVRQPDGAPAHLDLFVRRRHVRTLASSTPTTPCGVQTPREGSQEKSREGGAPKQARGLGKMATEKGAWGGRRAGVGRDTRSGWSVDDARRDAGILATADDPTMGRPWTRTPSRPHADRRATATPARPLRTTDDRHHRRRHRWDQVRAHPAPALGHGHPRPGLFPARRALGLTRRPRHGRRLGVHRRLPKGVHRRQHHRPAHLNLHWVVRHRRSMAGDNRAGGPARPCPDHRPHHRSAAVKAR